MYAKREIVFREFWGKTVSSEKTERPGLTYGELAERKCSGDDTKDLRETTGNDKQCGLQDGKAKGAENQRVLYANTSDKAAKGRPEEEREGLGVLEGFPESTEIHQCTVSMRNRKPKLTGVV